jgi:hypothetical protein
LGDVSSDRDEMPSDAQVLANATCSAEDDAHERGLLSWRKQDAEGILLLASAIKFLGSRTISNEGISQGEEFLTHYLNLCTEVCSMFKYDFYLFPLLGSYLPY